MAFYSGTGTVEVDGRKVIEGRYAVTQDHRNGGGIVVEDDKGKVVAELKKGRIDTDRMPAVIAVRSTPNA